MVLNFQNLENLLLFSPVVDEEFALFQNYHLFFVFLPYQFP